MIRKSPNPTDKHVGARVRMRRKMLGMSQGKVGDALILTFQQVQKYEKGTNRILASSDGLNLTKAFMLMKNAKLRRCIVDLVEELAGG